MPDTKLSNPIREGLATFAQHWYKVLGLFAIPVIGIALILFLGPVSYYLSLLLFPLMLPFLYNAYRFLWTSRDTIGPKLSLNPSNYTAQGGARGSLGVMYPLLFGALITDTVHALLMFVALQPLMRAYGYGAVVDQINAITSTEELTEYMMSSEAGQAMSGPLTVIYGLALYVGLILIVALMEKNRFNYVFMSRVLPDCDHNLSGTQARFLGKMYLRGYYWTRMRFKAPAVIPMWLALTLCYGGAIAGFSFITTDIPFITGALPILVLIPLAIVAVSLDASFDVPLADRMIPILIENNPQGFIEPVRNTFNSPEFIHTEDRAGMVPFQGLDRASQPTAADFDLTEGFYRSTASAEPLDPSASTPTERKDEPKAEQETKREGGFYGVIDFSKLDGKDTSNDEHGEED